ncbi:hypothetical protein E3E22_02980 [Thermococcus sp. MV5]|uniref:hypothetical protein n=1 Tax=Thermococcus sp. MV5 TaxID=1638272 RepID=UPI00143B6E58|nr:hypothetical protein [Thermococcus sp. MV5]NJE25600.1 hypothetical protein [Thermococcus sp. MV5]
MKKLISLLFLIILLPYVTAHSTITGWIEIPSRVGIEKYPLEIRDVSPTEGSLLIELNNKEYILKPEVLLNTSFYSVYMNSVFLKENGGYAAFNITFPYLLENQTVLVGDYSLTLLSVEENRAKIRLRYDDIEKELIYNGGKIEFNGLTVQLAVMPLLFDGYLYKGSAKYFQDWRIKFEEYNITEINGELKEFAKISINNKEYWIEVGDTLKAEGIIIETKELVGSRYLKTIIKINGAYASLSISPSLYKELEEGKDTQIGPYIVKLERIFSDGVYISIKNTCGMTLKSAWIRLGKIGTLVSYGGLHIGITEVSNMGTKKVAKIIGFLDEQEIPKVEEYAFANVSFLTPSNALQFEPFNGTITIKNTGDIDLKYIEIIPKLSEEFKIISSYPLYIPELKVGEKVEFNVRIEPKKGGFLRLGNIEIHANAPYQLSCDGFARISFSSETRWINVENATPKYKLVLKSQNSTVGSITQLNITVVNMGNTKGPFTITIAFPEQFAIIGENINLQGRFVYFEDSLNLNKNKTYSLLFIPIQEGEFEILAALKEGEYIIKNSTVAKIFTIPSPTEKESFENSTNETSTSTAPKIIKENTTTTATYTKVLNSTITVFPVKQKLLFGGVGFAGGVAFILLLAWIAAKLEERSRR